MAKNKGKYIAFEGVVGSGKSVQSQLLVQKLLQVFPNRMIIWTREPGGSEIAGEIRRVVQGMMFQEDMNPICEQYLYAASRSQTLRSVVEPILKRSGIVVADRSIFTSLAFQGYGRGLGIKTVLEINKVALGNIWPDLVIFLDLDLDEVMNRTKDKHGDKFEMMDKNFFSKVHQGYLEIAGKYKGIMKIVSGKGPVEEVAKRVWNVVSKELKIKI